MLPSMIRRVRAARAKLSRDEKNRLRYAHACVLWGLEFGGTPHSVRKRQRQRQSDSAFRPRALWEKTSVPNANTAAA